MKTFLDEIAEEIINSNIKKNDTIKVILNKSKTELVIKIQKPEQKKKKIAK